jgi:hypothetical protein
MRAFMGTSRSGCREGKKTAKPVALPRWQAIRTHHGAKPDRTFTHRLESAVRSEVHPETSTVNDDAPANPAGRYSGDDR